MIQILRCVLVFFIAASMVNFSVANLNVPNITTVFERYNCVPAIIKRGPLLPLNINYRSGAKVKEGNELTPAMVNDVPTVIWEADPYQYHTLVMFDPDTPTATNPQDREWQHWLVGNILGNNVAAGDTLAAYDPPRPLEGTGQHRYVFLVYQQPAHLEFDEPRLTYTHTSSEDRGGFSIARFARKYHLGDPVAGNLFMARGTE